MMIFLTILPFSVSAQLFIKDQNQVKNLNESDLKWIQVTTNKILGNAASVSYYTDDKNIFGSSGPITDKSGERVKFLNTAAVMEYLEKNGWECVFINEEHNVSRDASMYFKRIQSSSH